MYFEWRDDQHYAVNEVGALLDQLLSWPHPVGACMFACMPVQASSPVPQHELLVHVQHKHLVLLHHAHCERRYLQLGEDGP